MATNKVVLNGETIIDLSQDTAVEDVVAEGYSFHKANGERAVGRAVFESEVAPPKLEGGSATENGTYYPREGFSGFSHFIVAVPQSTTTVYDGAVTIS